MNCEQCKWANDYLECVLPFRCQIEPKIVDGKCDQFKEWE